MGRDELVPRLPGFSDGLIVGRTDFILQHLEVHLMSTACESLHNGSVRCNPVSIVARLEGGIQNGVSITVKRYHDVLIATPLSDGEEAAVISVNVDYGLLIDTGEEGYRVFSCCYFGGGGLVRIGFSGSDSLAGLDHVKFNGLY